MNHHKSQPSLCVTEHSWNITLRHKLRQCGGGEWCDMGVTKCPTPHLNIGKYSPKNDTTNTTKLAVMRDMGVTQVPPYQHHHQPVAGSSNMLTSQLFYSSASTVADILNFRSQQMVKSLYSRWAFHFITSRNVQCFTS